MRERLHAGPDDSCVELSGTDWAMVLTDADACATPAALADVDGAWVQAPVPGTVAQALEDAGRFAREAPTPLDGSDAWYVRHLSTTPGRAIIEFDGLATCCDVFVNDEHVASTDNMFRRYRVPVELTGEDRLALCFRALGPRLAPPGPRARWRQQLAEPRTLKNLRTTLLGRMPGWCPSVQAVGPWRPVRLRHETSLEVVALSARLDAAGTGHLRVSLRGQLPGADRPRIRCAGHETELLANGEPEGWTAELELPDVPTWWPHTHGSPVLHDVLLVTDTVLLSLAHTGFRRIDVDLGPDGEGFGLLVNGVPVFSRGAVWTTADIVRLPGSREDYGPWLRLARDSGMNLVRVGGTMAYETSDFFALCDELGIMVWQDFMFANFDYPSGDEPFIESVRAEAEDLLSEVRAAPSLAVLCGGSEVFQQAAMFGRSAEFWTHRLFDEVLPDVAARLRPDVAYVPNSPFGGSTPFTPRTAVTHYYGVGAYLRPLTDARLAHVRFAAESLAFSHVPQEATTSTAGLADAAVHHPRWKERVPRDRGASWDFEDVRDFYLALLYDQPDPQVLRRRDPERYLALSRAVTGEVMEQTYAEWRRPGSSCRGALVWTFQDLLPGAGWGIVDSTGEPKPAWYALRRAWRPVQVLLIDEGTNGVDVHLINETAEPILNADVEVLCLRDGAQTVMRGHTRVDLDPHTSRSMACTELFGAFFDTNHAFAFGSPTHDTVVARLSVDGVVAAEAVLFPHGRTAALHPQVGLTADVVRVADHGWAVELSTDQLAQSVHLDIEGYRPEDDWFHLTPGVSRQVRLLPRSDADTAVPPRGRATPLAGEPVGLHHRP